MTKTARERLARRLGDSEPAGSFSAQLLAPAHLLQLEVSGVGSVGLPVRAPLAKKLIALARPAMFGRAEETLTDTSVRDTWELTPDQITLGGPGWTALMERALEHFRDELGLPQTSRLRAELHSMLVYGKGQFFLPHQDSEKDDAMVGTLVVSLPSAHTGGELVVDHAGQSTAYRASKDELTFVAFYADCRHQVTPVRSGYRVTLTFNLLSAAETPAPEADPGTELVHCLTEHFTTPATPRYGSRDLAPPNRLVLLLDHEYTQRGLNWRRLKGADAERAELLRAAAKRAGCETVLALAEVKETWDALPSGNDRHDYYDDYYGARRRRGLNRLSAQRPDRRRDHPRLVDQPGRHGRRVDLVARSRLRGVRHHPERGPDALPVRVRGLHGQLRQHAGSVVPTGRSCRMAPGPSVRSARRGRIAVGAPPASRPHRGRRPGWRTCRVGVTRTVLEDGGGTAGVRSVQPWTWRRAWTRPGRQRCCSSRSVSRQSRRSMAGGLAAAAGRYGDEWTRSVVDGWFGPGHPYGTELYQWVDNRLSGLCEALRAAGEPTVARLLVAGAWRRMDTHGTARSGSTRSSRGRRATRTTGRSHGSGVGAVSVTRSGRSSAPGRGGSSSGHWRRTDAGTCTPRSTRPGCRCGTRPGGRGGHTRWC